MAKPITPPALGSAIPGLRPVKYIIQPALGSRITQGSRMAWSCQCPGRVLLVALVDVEREAVADPRPVVQVGAGRMSDPLLQPVLGVVGAGVEEVPEPVVPAPPSRSRWCSRPTPAFGRREQVPLYSQVFRSRLVAWPCVTLKWRRSGFSSALSACRKKPCQ